MDGLVLAPIASENGAKVRLWFRTREVDFLLPIRRHGLFGAEILP